MPPGVPQTPHWNCSYVPWLNHWLNHCNMISCFIWDSSAPHFWWIKSRCCKLWRNSTSSMHVPWEQSHYCSEFKLLFLRGEIILIKRITFAVTFSVIPSGFMIASSRRHVLQRTVSPSAPSDVHLCNLRYFFLFFPSSRFTGARGGRIPWPRARDFPSLTRGHSRFPPDNSLLFTSKTTVSDRS